MKSLLYINRQRVACSVSQNTSTDYKNKDDLLIGCTLYICQGGEIIPDSSKAGQNLKHKKRKSKKSIQWTNKYVWIV